MATSRPFRFGVQMAKGTSFDDWVSKARKAEDLGYSVVSMPDHFGDQLAPVPALMAAALATTDLRIGTLVLDNDYRHPLVLAKEAATLDLLSGGRLELGIGAGWMQTDYDESGIACDPPGVRVDRLEEGVAVLKGLFAEGPLSFDGKHYTITGHEGTPKPVQKPHPPFLIGGGAKRVLTLAGREADIVGINFDLRSGAITADLGPNGTADLTDQKLQWVRDGAGERFDQLELTVSIFFALPTDDRKGTAEAMAGRFKISPAQALEVPHVLVGTVEQMVEDLQARRDRWRFSYIVFSGDAFESLGPVVERLAGT